MRQAFLTPASQWCGKRPHPNTVCEVVCTPLVADFQAPLTPGADPSRTMTLGKRLLLFSARDPVANGLVKIAADWSCMTFPCSSIDELRGRIEGSDFDYALIEPSSSLRKLIGENSLEESLKLPLAEVEKRHIHRVLASTNGNKTRAARILGIDTKTLYNKLKSYKASEDLARKRAAQGAPTA